MNLIGLSEITGKFVLSTSTRLQYFKSAAFNNVKT